MFDRIRRLWRVDTSMAKRLGENMRERFELQEQVRGLTKLIKEYEEGSYEKTKAGTVDWKMEVDRLNRINNDLESRLAVTTARLAETEARLKQLW